MVHALHPFGVRRQEVLVPVWAVQLLLQPLRHASRRARHHQNQRHAARTSYRARKRRDSDRRHSRNQRSPHEKDGVREVCWPTVLFARRERARIQPIRDLRVRTRGLLRRLARGVYEFPYCVLGPTSDRQRHQGPGTGRDCGTVYHAARLHDPRQA